MRAALAAAAVAGIMAAYPLPLDCFDRAVLISTVVQNAETYMREFAGCGKQSLMNQGGRQCSMASDDPYVNTLHMRACIYIYIYICICIDRVKNTPSIL